MCAIAGLWSTRGQAVDPNLLEAMGAAMAHRGPDGDGLQACANFGLAHRRLSLLDFEGSPQPMQRGRFHISYNGEVFNYKELRLKLLRSGVQLSSAGDTEVLLRWFQIHGLAGLQQLEGQFAFAWVDEEAGHLWLVRDPMGNMPLYYRQSAGMLSFASEIKGLLPCLPKSPELNPLALENFLATRSVPAPLTFWKGIHKLPAGHALRIDARGKVEIKNYWNITGQPKRSSDPPAECIERTEQLLIKAVKGRMVADAPVGAFLSGGLDSSLIVALMAAANPRQAPQTFTASFAESRFNENHQAEATARALGVSNRCVQLHPQMYLDDWQRLSAQRDAPLSEPADIAVYRTARLASESVKAVLSGEGADEIFLGYPKYRMGRILGMFSAQHPGAPGFISRRLERTLGRKHPRLRIALRALGEPNPEERMRAWFAPFTARERRQLIGLHRASPMATGCAARHGSLAERMSQLDCGSWLADNLLERGDRMCMAASIELRTPYLDLNLMKHVMGLPCSLRLRRFQGKWLLRQVALKYLPKQVVFRKKHGFHVPLRDWFRGSWSATLRERLLDSGGFVGSHLDQRLVADLIKRHLEGQSDEGIRLWTLLSLEVWHQGFEQDWQSARPAAGLANA